MKHQWVAYVIVALLSIGAGIAIAGLPNNVPVDATIEPPVTTEPPARTLPETTDPVATTEPEPTETSTTSTSTTEPPVETTEPDASIPLRSEVTVVAVNGADIGGAAARMAERLRGIGHTEVLTRDGTEVRDFTWVYYADGFEGAAARLADDLEMFPEFIAPADDAPGVLELPAEFDMIVYVGTDRA